MSHRSSAELHRAEHRRTESEPDAFGSPVRADVHLIALYGGLDHREQPSAVVVSRKRARDEVGREIGQVEPLQFPSCSTSFAPGHRAGTSPRPISRASRVAKSP